MRVELKQEGRKHCSLKAHSLTWECYQMLQARREQLASKQILMFNPVEQVRCSSLTWRPCPRTYLPQGSTECLLVMVTFGYMQPAGSHSALRILIPRSSHKSWMRSHSGVGGSVDIF